MQFPKRRIGVSGQPGRRNKKAGAVAIAWLDAYATASDYRNRIDKSVTTDDTAILASLTAISRMIEQELGRVFNQGAAGEVRYFDAGIPLGDDDPRSIFLVTPVIYGPYAALTIDDVVTVTGVASDTDGNGVYETVSLSTDYNLKPYNAAVSGKPYTRLELVRSPSQAIGGYTKAVAITGTWGWPSVPAPVKEATIQLAAILRLETPRAQATVSEIGQLVTMSKAGRGIVDRLIHEFSRKPLLV